MYRCNLREHAFFNGTRRMNASHQVEEVDEELRQMMTWISVGKTVDKEFN